MTLFPLEPWWTLTGEVAATANSKDACVVDPKHLCHLGKRFACIHVLYVCMTGKSRKKNTIIVIIVSKSNFICTELETHSIGKLKRNAFP